jgi:hypothetical protein
MISTMTLSTGGTTPIGAQMTAPFPRRLKLDNEEPTTSLDVGDAVAGHPNRPPLVPRHAGVIVQRAPATLSVEASRRRGQLRPAR